MHAHVSHLLLFPHPLNIYASDGTIAEQECRFGFLGMASKVASSSHTGPTHGWDDDSPAGIELEVPKSYTSSRRSRSSRPPPTYVGQESDENDAALIGTDGGQVWCSSAVVQENAPELARYLVQNSHGQTSAKRRIKMPMNTEQLSLLVAALEPTTCAKIPW